METLPCPTPLPWILTVCAPPTLSVKVTELVCSPIAVGLNCTPIRQLPPWARTVLLWTQVVMFCPVVTRLNAVPVGVVNAGLPPGQVIVVVAFPAFVRKISACGIGEGVSSTWPKSSRVGPPAETETVITAGSPVPVRFKVCGEAGSAPTVPANASVMTSELLSVVVVLGVKVIAMTQLPPAGIVPATHVLSVVTLKSAFPGGVIDWMVIGTVETLRNKNSFFGVVVLMI